MMCRLKSMPSPSICADILRADVCVCADVGDVSGQSGKNSSESADEGADEPSAEDSSRNATASADVESDAAETADESGDAADNSTLPARRSLLGSAARLLEGHSSAASVRQPTLFRRALRAAGGWSELLGRFRKADETGEIGAALARRPRPSGQPNVAITTAIPPNPCG